jgi:hypothetical protein
MSVGEWTGWVQTNLTFELDVQCRDGTTETGPYGVDTFHELHLADGREIRVGHPDALAWQGPDFAPFLHIVHADGRWEVVNFAAITSFSPAGSPATSDGA